MLPWPSVAKEGSPMGWTFPLHGRSPMSVKVFPPSLETEEPLKLMAGRQQTRESLKPTTTFWPTATTVVSLWVFRGDASSSARQFTWTLPVVLVSAGQMLPAFSDGEGAVTEPLRMRAITSADN